ncbi:FIG004453: protein YceG like [hydrothermal vent metagenome]|uniref:FIG004453: protein YceG like n=1 Tax=hydrothermal vent metagenome TaxID=652676 RepID=A0A1W1EII4_9ZZZZ
MIKKFFLFIITGVINLIIIVILSATFYLNIPIESQGDIKIPKGSVSKIISYLTNKGYNLSIIDRYILVAIGTPKSGWINIPKGEMDRIKFLTYLTDAKFTINKITLIPGETLYIFLEDISKQLKLDNKKLLNEYNRISPYKEAGIYPDTYHIPKGIKEKKLMEFLIRESNKKYQKIYAEYTNSNEFNSTSFNVILTIASIIQKEAGNNIEMPIVASVIYNRISKGMPLQMDGTLNYGKYSHIKITPKRIKEDNTTFNTYKHKGIPNYPVASASVEAIKSAINPTVTKYLYFMKNSQGGHNFAKTYSEHRKNIKDRVE